MDFGHSMYYVTVKKVFFCIAEQSRVVCLAECVKVNVSVSVCASLGFRFQISMHTPRDGRFKIVGK